jgi:hypothetical protein
MPRLHGHFRQRNNDHHDNDHHAAPALLVPRLQGQGHQERMPDTEQGVQRRGRDQVGLRTLPALHMWRRRSDEMRSEGVQPRADAQADDRRGGVEEEEMSPPEG